eukprot:TRINITY_DN81422_c0_g1_i1.p1 TRINITY_DN81422_c0_g1~~TRINITY_DN81422_c0_g1_i1.p1  ORF type:complete len:319 (-),score=57.39 TRINITY_DN81422_c0_g1_i1:22-978(-)
MDLPDVDPSRSRRTVAAEGSVGSMVLPVAASFEAGSCTRDLNEDDGESVLSASTLGLGSTRTARRARQKRQMKKQADKLEGKSQTRHAETPRTGSRALDIDAKSKEIGVQCSLGSEAAELMRLQKKCAELRRKLNEARLKTLVERGKLNSMMRIIGAGSDLDSDEAAESSSSDGYVSGDAPTDEKDEQYSNGGDSGCSSSSLPADIGMGDMVLISGLQSARGSQLNGYYGKVISVDGVRVGVHVRGQNLSLKPENMELAMKEEEMSSEDERLFESLAPLPDHIKELPYVERMRALSYVASRTQGQKPQAQLSSSKNSL